MVRTRERLLEIIPVVSMSSKGGALLTELNYSLLSRVILFNILEMAEVETADNFATPAKGILNSFANRSAIPERTCGILPRRLP